MYFFFVMNAYVFISVPTLTKSFSPLFQERMIPHSVSLCVAEERCVLLSKVTRLLVFTYWTRNQVNVPPSHFYRTEYDREYISYQSFWSLLTSNNPPTRSHTSIGRPTKMILLKLKRQVFCIIYWIITPP